MKSCNMFFENRKKKNQKNNNSPLWYRTKEGQRSPREMLYFWKQCLVIQTSRRKNPIPNPPFWKNEWKNLSDQDFKYNVSLEICKFWLSLNKSKDQFIYFKRIVPIPSISQSHSLNLISWESGITMLTSQGLFWFYKIIQKIRMSPTHIISAALIMKGANNFPTQQLPLPKKLPRRNLLKLLNQRNTISYVRF